MLLWCYMIVLAECSPINIVLLDVIYVILKNLVSWFHAKYLFFLLISFVIGMTFLWKNAWRFLTVHGGINFRLHWPPVPGFADPRFAMSDRSYVLIIEWDDTSWRWRVHERRHMGIRRLFTRYSGLIYPLPPHYRVQLYTDQLSTFGHVHPSVSSTFGMY